MLALTALVLLSFCAHFALILRPFCAHVLNVARMCKICKYVRGAILLNEMDNCKMEFFSLGVYMSAT